MQESEGIVAGVKQAGFSDQASFLYYQYKHVVWIVASNITEIMNLWIIYVTNDCLMFNLCYD